MATIGSDGRQGRGVACRALMILGMALMAGPPCPGQFAAGGPKPSTKVYFDSSHNADALLRSAENHVKAGDFAEAVEIYRRVIQEFGDKVVAVPVEATGGSDDSRLSVNARRECQRRIAALPPEARALYRGRVDAQAERWFRQGAAARDRSLLRRVVDQSFCSSWGDDALDLLGDLAFQDGQFAEALSAYTQLVPERPAGPQGLIHPDPSVDLARVVAKKFLCRAAIGEHPPTPPELAAFAAAQPPGGTSTFAGRRGPLGRILSEAIRDDHLVSPASPDGRWPTFAGSPTRDRVAPGSIDVGSLQWRVELEPIAPTRSGGFRNRQFGAAAPAVQVPAEKLLAYHPIVVGDQVMVADGKQILAFDLNTRPGEPSAGPAHVESAWKKSDLMGPAAGGGSGGLARYTLTAQGHRVYARMGPPPSTAITMNRMGMGGFGTAPPSSIVALDRSGEGKLLWRREASEIGLPRRVGGGGNRNAVFEGSPVADARNVYVAMTDRIEMTATYVACLDAEFGAVKWVRYVCEANANADPFFNAGFEISHRLLTLDGPTLYYQTNLGAVASLDAESGGVRWLATYPWAGRNANGGGHERDLNPAVVHDGLVIVAPDDAPAIYAFDAATGRLAWKTDPIPDEARLTHLLGVAKGQVIAAGDRVLWFDARTGKLAHAWPDNANAVQGFGRGILAGDRVYWPTRTQIHVLDQASGLMADAPIKLQETYQCEGGNLAVGDGYLIVAQSNALVVFCQNSRLIDRYRQEIARAPDQAANYYRLAQAAEAIGRDDLALDSLELALPRSRPSETIDGVPIGEAARDHQRRLLMKLGQKARAARDWAGAARRFEAAAEAARSDRDRLAARLELADVQLARGEPKASVATLQALLADERARALNVDASDGHRSIRADLLIADRLAGLLRDRGREDYADFDRAAAALLGRGVAEGDPRLLEDVGRSYPVAKVVPDAWLALGALNDRLGRPGDSARAYKRLLASASGDEQRARALWGLAHAYEAQKLWGSARDAYLQARARFAPMVLGDLGDRPLGDLIGDRLAADPFKRLAGDRAEPNVPTPLRRRWDRRWSEPSRPLAADGVPPSAEAGAVFLAQGRTIRPVDPASGASAWSRDLEGEPVWVGYLADRIIAATRTRLVALSLDKGAVEWQHDLGAGAAGPAVANPFAREAVAEAGRDAGPSPLSDFRIVGNRIFCLRGDQALMAFDGDSGLVDWSYTPPAGRINPHLLVGPRRIVLQVRKPNAVLVLDTATGRRQGEFARLDDEEWPRDPLPIDDDHVALVADRMTVALFDVARGVNAWVFRETAELPRYGAPRLLGDADRLLVLHDGRELIRLDPATGAKAWARLLGSEDLSDRPEAIALGGDRAFVANGATLAAVSLLDGSTLWKRPLNGPTAAGWAVALAERSVAAFPVPSKGREEYLSTLPLVFRRRDDGDLIQRLLIQASVSDLAVRFSPRGALVATQGGLWALGDRQVIDGPKASR